MLFNYFTLFVAVLISAIGELYSITGLTAIFPGAFWSIIVLGTALGIGKITAATWLKLNWEYASVFVRTYLIIAVSLLMFLTSMGIFGVLSKAHISQNAPTAEVAAQIAAIDIEIQTEKENIAAARKSLQQMDEAVDQVLARSSDERGAERSAQLRKSQSKERALLTTKITSAQSKIAAKNVTRAPLDSQLRLVETEVGPIKFIAAFFYGETDPVILEKAVTWVIILIIIVFDPLALILLIAASTSIQRLKQQKELSAKMVPPINPNPLPDPFLRVEPELLIPAVNSSIIEDNSSVREEVPIELPIPVTAVKRQYVRKVTKAKKPMPETPVVEKPKKNKKIKPIVEKEVQEVLEPSEPKVRKVTKNKALKSAAEPKLIVADDIPEVITAIVEPEVKKRKPRPKGGWFPETTKK